ncbi:MAG: chromosome partitioning protein, partial [Nanoarchaeota archaeon]|nr:chromosome partitioning protein [Nanoarchaeota archaeon]
AFRTSAKNIAAQCSILAAKMQDEMKAESTESTVDESPKTN